MSSVTAHQSARATESNEHSQRPARAMLVSLALPVFLSSIASSIANVALPSLAHAFGASVAAVKWVVVAYLLGLTLTSVTTGGVGDRLGRPRVMLWGLGLFAVASTICALAPSLFVLLAARALQGVGASMMTSMAMAIVMDTSSTSRAGSAIGIMGTLSATGTALGPSVGGVLISAFGWRAIFIVMIAVGTVALVLASRSLNDDARADARESSAGSNRARVRSPGRRAGLALLRTRGLAAALVMTTLMSTVMMATMVVGPFHLARALGLDTARVGFALSIGPVVAALCGVPAGRLVDRFGARAVTLTGLGIAMAGCVLAAIAPIAIGAAGYLAPIAVITAGYALFQTANNAAVMTGAPSADRGTAAGLLNLFRNLGLVAGAWAMGAVFARVAGSSAAAAGTPGAVAAATHATFAVAAALMAVSLLLASSRRSATARRASGYAEVT